MFPGEREGENDVAGRERVRMLFRQSFCASLEGCIMDKIAGAFRGGILLDISLRLVGLRFSCFSM